MSKGKRYSPEFKRELVDVVRRSQSSCRQVALEVGVNPNQLSRRVREAAAGAGKAFPGGGVPRDECLAMEWFKNRIDAKVVIETFRRGYNEVRPHSSLGQLTPVEFKRSLSTTNPDRAIF